MEDIAARLARGITIMFADMGLAALSELPLPNGRRADLIAIDDRGEIVIVEIKSSRIDFVTDRKWRDYLEFCDRFFFGVAPDFPLDMLPAECGLILADGYGAAVMRPAPSTPLHAARRRAQTLRIAQTACRRLMRLDLAMPALSVSR
ncbi:MAG: MmcB family DNA repair protein [Dongiaceae bacterium]